MVKLKYNTVSLLVIILSTKSICYTVSYFTAFFSASTLSVFSHGKRSRPKWP